MNVTHSSTTSLATALRVANSTITISTAISKPTTVLGAITVVAAPSRAQMMVEAILVSKSTSTSAVSVVKALSTTSVAQVASVAAVVNAVSTCTPIFITVTTTIVSVMEECPGHVLTRSRHILRQLRQLSTLSRRL